ncbi:MAG: metallophosphoesterase [Flavobacteriaceae bacterium]
MLKFLLYPILIGISITSAFGQISDGPYVFIEKGQLIEKSIIKGEVFTEVLGLEAFDTIYSPEKSVYEKVKKVVALSDIHGQYDLAVALLQNNKIIDKDLNWNFGKGHLVIVGDIFDRGPKVNETLWLIYKLEAQAKKRGGQVHYLLGNHEYMILHKDLRYINKKYETTATLLNTSYDQLYGENTVLGRWLRSKATLVKINGDVFVHGGVSKDFLAKNDFDLEQINQIMRASISKSKAEMKSTDFYKTYYGSKSLIWYRGYFNDNLQDSEITELLQMMHSDHEVVGHCTNEEVVSLYNNKIFGVDSGLKNGKYGELLIIKRNKYYRATLSGEKTRFK